MTPLEKILKKATEPTNPWYHTRLAGREYLTPEDVDDAIKVGGTVLRVTEAVLQAVDLKCIEDASAAAFVALKMFKGRK